MPKTFPGFKAAGQGSPVAVTASSSAGSGWWCRSPVRLKEVTSSDMNFRKRLLWTRSMGCIFALGGGPAPPGRNHLTRGVDAIDSEGQVVGRAWRDRHSQ